MNAAKFLLERARDLAAALSPRLNKERSEEEVENILISQQATSLQAHEERYGRYGKVRDTRTRSRRGRGK